MTFAFVLSRTFHALLLLHPLLVVAALIGVEELGVPSPVPGDLMMLYAGVLVAQHRAPLWLVLLVQEVATLVGASGLFLISRRLGRPFILRYGHFIHLTPHRLARVEGAVQRHGALAVVVGRLIPGLRIITPIATGVLGVPFLVFLPAVALGGFLYLLVLTLVGVLVGPTALDVFERLSQPLTALCSFLAATALLVIIRRARPVLRAKRGLLLGVVAGVGALLTTNAGVGLLRFGFRTAGAAQVLASVGVGSGWRLALGWPVFLVVASLLGALYHAFALHHWPVPLRVGMLIVPPFLLVAFVLFPLLGERLPRIGAPRETALLVVEGVRWLAFGLILNVITPTAGERPSDPDPERGYRDGDARNAAPPGRQSHTTIVATSILLLLTATTDIRATDGYPSGAQGYDRSFPQCDLPFPSVAAPFFAVIGVTSGHAFRPNPCFASQYVWAASGTVAPPAVYLNLNEDIGVTGGDGDTGPYGPCGPDDTCHALNYGYNAAGSAYASVTGAVPHFGATRWWLDIETENSWAESDLARNRAVIAGAVRFLQEERGFAVGIYSTAAQWQEVTGGWQSGMPVWVGGASEGDAQTQCGTGFTGGPVYLVQYETDDGDADYAC